MRVLLYDHVYPHIRTNLAIRKAITMFLAVEQLKQQLPMQTIHIQNIDRYPMTAERMSEPKRPQGMDKPRRIDLHRAGKGRR